MTYFFTSDEHYGHANIIKYCNRPFQSVEEMDTELIRRFNEKVTSQDITVHAGDFTLRNKEYAENIIKQLNGNHIFLKGNHDRWLPKSNRTMWRKRIREHLVLVCHFPFATWEAIEKGSINLHGHTHGNYEPQGLQFDIGVDSNNFYPLSDYEVFEIMWSRDYYCRDRRYQ